ncbi:MAG: hypothetical protein CMJ87_10595 [Planctomycetes bacterium]|jgi:formylglycine-generating enzyme required for sulfatase activity|nr:hypothetical protein [Planctomycetota bacterium]
MVFVPGCSLELGPGATCPAVADLLVERFEVSRGQWRRWLAEGSAETFPLAEAEAWGVDGDTWPATWMTLEEAEDYAVARGLRLPTACEWLRIAGGQRGRPWPWGAGRARAVANTLELGLGRLLACGTFERGRSPEGVHDLLGNAAEWTRGRVTESLAARGHRDGALGGSYRTRGRPLSGPTSEGGLAYNEQGFDRRHRAADLGFRCVAGAEEYLRSQASGWSRDAALLGRLRSVGQSWGGAALPLLERLAAEEGAAPGLRALLEGARR